MTTQQQPVQLTNEEKAKVFAMYLGAEVSGEYMDEPCTGYLTGIHGEYGAEIQWIMNGHAEEDPDYKEYNECQLLLTPISAITDEDAVEVYDMQLGVLNLTRANKIETVKYWVNTNELTWDQYEYLKSKFYAVPIFFAPKHPANGKTAIELGIAREKTN